jgi:flagellar FliL protein
MLSSAMSKEPTSETAAPAEAPKKSNMPMIVMGIGIASIIGAGAIVFLGQSSAKAEKHAPKSEHGEEAGEHDAEEATDDGHGGDTKGAFNQKVDAFIANLTSDDGEMHYIKCTLTVELGAESDVAKLDKKLPRVRQDVLLYLSGLTMSQTEGGEAKRKIRDGLDATVKAAAGKNLVKNVFVVELVVQ